MSTKPPGWHHENALWSPSLAVAGWWDFFPAVCAREVSLGSQGENPFLASVDCGQKVSWAPSFNLMALGTQYDLLCRGNELLMKTCKQGPSLGWATEGMPVSQGSWPLHPHSPGCCWRRGFRGAKGRSSRRAQCPRRPGTQSQAGEERKQQTAQSKAAAPGRVGDARKVDSGRRRATPVMFYFPDSELSRRSTKNKQM